MLIEQKEKPLVVNLWGGPGTGKSTTSTGIFHYLKLDDVNCELVTEYAKSLVWAEHWKAFNNQLCITAKQNEQLENLRGKVDVAITDSPLLLALAYTPEGYYPSYTSLVKEVFDSYDNINIFLRRVKKFNPVGRNQNEEEARKIDKVLRDLLAKYDVPFIEMDGDKKAAFKIAELVFNQLT